MKLFASSKGTGGDNPGPIAFVLALIWFAISKPASFLKEKAYGKGFSGWIGRGFGTLIALGTAVASANYFDLPWYGTWGVGLLGYLLTYNYIWPALYIFPIHPAWKLVEAIMDGVNDFLKGNFEKICKGILSIFRILPFSSGMWGELVDEKPAPTDPAVKRDKHWFSKGVQGVAYAAAILITGYCTLQVWGIASAWVALPWVGTIIGLGAAVLTILVVGGLLGGTLYYGGLPFIAFTTGGIALWQWGGALASLTGLEGALFYAAAAGVYVAYVSWVFPFVNLLFSDTFLRKVYDTLKPLYESTYNEKDKAYATFYRNTVNILLAIALGIGSYIIASLLGAGLFLAGGIAAVVAFFSYVGVYELIDHDGATHMFSGLLSAVAGGFTIWFFWGSGSWLNITASTLAGSFAGAIVYFLLFPLGYGFFRLCTRGSGLSGIGESLEKAHKSVEKAVEDFFENVWKSVFEKSYKDRTPYQELFLHVTNIAITYGAYLFASWGMAALGAGFWVGTAAVVIATGLSYLLVGKGLFKSGYGTEFVGAVASLAFGIWVGSLVYGLNPVLWVGVVAFIVACAAICFGLVVAFPLAYIFVRTLTNWILTFWLRPVLAGIHSFFWAGFEGFWGRVVSAFAVIGRLLAPVFAAIGRQFRRIADAYNRIIDRIRKR